jgi:hypothetical protein
VFKESYFAIMPITGKALFIDAVEAASSGDLAMANKIAETLTYLVSRLGVENSRLDPHQHQIQQELWRITRELTRFLQEQTKK